MNDEIIQKHLSRFQGEYRHFSLKATIQDNNSLLLTFINNNNYDFFQTIIDQKYIQSDSSFVNIFEQPSDIIDFLHAHFKQVTLQDGAIKFQFRVGRYNSKIIIIKVQKKEISPSMLLNIKLAKMKEEFKTGISKMSQQKDQIIGQLQQRVKDNERKVQMLEGQLVQATRSIAVLIEQSKSPRPIDQKRKEYQQRPTKRTEERRQVQKPQVKSNYFFKTTQEELQKVAPKKTEERRSFAQKTSSALGNHSQNPHRDFFKINREGKYLSLIRCTENGWYSFVNEQEIKNGQFAKYMIKTKKITNQNCCIGFGTKATFGYAKASQAEAVFYLLNGNIFQCGKCKTAEGKCDEGDAIKVECDLVENTITWRKKSGRIGSTSLPQNLRGKVLYLLILLNFKGDEVAVSLQE